VVVIIPVVVTILPVVVPILAVLAMLLLLKAAFLPVAVVAILLALVVRSNVVLPWPLDSTFGAMSIFRSTPSRECAS
jgi:hypothetical protein